MAMSSRDRRAILWGGGILLAVVLYRFVLTPMFAQWGEARATIAAYEAQIAQVDLKLAQREAMRGRLRDRFGAGVDQPLMSVDRARIELPRQGRRAITAAGAQVSEIELQAVRKLREAPGVAMVSVRVRLTCNEQSLARMLAQLRTLDLPVLVDQISLSMAQADQRDKWQCVLVLSSPAVQAGGAS